MTDLDHQYESNMRAPIALTQSLLPCLRRARGHIVFVNSTAGLVARANASQFAATQHAMRAFATALRDEVNKDGIRVTTVFPGRTVRHARSGSTGGRQALPARALPAARGHRLDRLGRDQFASHAAEVTELTIRSMAKI